MSDGLKTAGYYKKCPYGLVFKPPEPLADYKWSPQGNRSAVQQQKPLAHGSAVNPIVLALWGNTMTK